MAWTPTLIDAFDNLIARRDELEAAKKAVADSATPSYWIEREALAYDKARQTFFMTLDDYIDQRIRITLGNMGIGPADDD